MQVVARLMCSCKQVKGSAVTVTKTSKVVLKKGDRLEARRTGVFSTVVGFADGKKKIKLRSDSDGRTRLSVNDPRQLSKRFYL